MAGMQTLPSPSHKPPAETAEKIERFRTLYRLQFGVESKPEYEALLIELPLTPEQAMQLLEDLTHVVHHVFDAYFAQRTALTPLQHVPGSAAEAS